MSPWVESALVKYGWIWIGLTFGLAAKYALLIKRGVTLRPALVVADILLLPLVALISYAAIERIGVTGEAAALLTALATVGADRLVKLYSERFLKSVEHELGAVSAETIGKVRQAAQAEMSAERVIDDMRRKNKERQQ